MEKKEIIKIKDIFHSYIDYIPTVEKYIEDNGYDKTIISFIKDIENMTNNYFEVIKLRENYLNSGLNILTVKRKSDNKFFKIRYSETGNYYEDFKETFSENILINF